VVWILGLTGSIGTGKSTVSRFFGETGTPVHDADAAVHRLYAGAAVAPIEAAFPGTTRDGVVDRTLLSARVVADPTVLKRLEAIIHPMVRALEAEFLATARGKGVSLVVLDIPLLFETGAETRCDAVAVVSAPEDIQRRRVMSRSGMTTDKFAVLLAKQLPDAEKRKRAHVVIDTSGDFNATRRQVRDVIRMFAGRHGGRR
jgi:dephospho-CoA kinase